jgi:hypothetical protein
VVCKEEIGKLREKGKEERREDSKRKRVEELKKYGEIFQLKRDRQIETLTKWKRKI